MGSSNEDEEWPGEVDAKANYARFIDGNKALVESWNAVNPPGGRFTANVTGWPSMPVSTLSRAFLLGGVACAWCHEMPYPVPLCLLGAADEEEP